MESLESERRENAHLNAENGRLSARLNRDSGKRVWEKMQRDCPHVAVTEFCDYACIDDVFLPKCEYDSCPLLKEEE